MAWRRVNHPSEILTIGEMIKVQVIKINKAPHFVGMKQLKTHEIVAAKYHWIGAQGTVTNITVTVHLLN